MDSSAVTEGGAVLSPPRLAVAIVTISEEEGGEGDVSSTERAGVVFLLSQSSERAGWRPLLSVSSVSNLHEACRRLMSIVG